MPRGRAGEGQEGEDEHGEKSRGAGRSTSAGHVASGLSPPAPSSSMACASGEGRGAELWEEARRRAASASGAASMLKPDGLRMTSSDSAVMIVSRFTLALRVERGGPGEGTGRAGALCVTEQTGTMAAPTLQQSPRPSTHVAPMYDTQQRAGVQGRQNAMNGPKLPRRLASI